MLAEAKGSDTARLSVSQILCLRWAAHGRTMAEIARIEFIDQREVETYLMLAQRALRVGTLEDAVCRATALHLL